jgi:hypothetical protein
MSSLREEDLLKLFSHLKERESLLLKREKSLEALFAGILLREKNLKYNELRIKKFMSDKKIKDLHLEGA